MAAGVHNMTFTNRIKNNDCFYSALANTPPSAIGRKTDAVNKHHLYHTQQTNKQATTQSHIVITT